MKKILLVCLLGLGMLLPTNNVSAAKEHAHIRKIGVMIDGNVLIASSDRTDGPISMLEVKALPDGKLWASQSCNDYTCSTDVSNLPTGLYVAQVYTAYGKCTTWQFKK